jgi:hypothetical protein
MLLMRLQANSIFIQLTELIKLSGKNKILEDSLFYVVNPLF